jgi:tryptophan-rich sensory protein
MPQSQALDIQDSSSPGRNPRAIAAAGLIALITFGVAAGGALVTDPDSEWYRALEKPSFNPPGAVFGPVWTVIYLLTAGAAWLAWRDVGESRRRAVLWVFAINAALNLLWTVLFFGAHSPWAAALEIVPLLGTIIALIWMVRPWNKTAALALVPYAAWVSFATVLTWTIAIQNS